LIAERTGDYQGQTAPEWADVRIVNGQPVISWYPVWPFTDRPPHAARVGVYRRGFTDPLVAVARFDAYAQTKYGGELNRMWARMGPEQLAKCAEALALRKAFPHELSGVYTDDEMQQADDDAAQKQRAAAREEEQRVERERAEQIAKLPRRFPDERPVPFMLPGKYKNVPIDAKHAAPHPKFGQYVVSDTMIARALEFLDGKMNAATSADDKKRIAKMRDAVAREQTTRAMEAQEQRAPKGDAFDAPATGSAPADGPDDDREQGRGPGADGSEAEDDLPF
jgi:hypothetical protein